MEKPSLSVAAYALAVVAAATVAMGTIAAEERAGSTSPPRSGKFVGDHWTPYDPPSPESFPQGSKIHLIVPGDTLWDLSAKYLENPFLWPQIWDVNQYITDSHWIYPGDPLLIPGKPTVISEKGPGPSIEMLEPPATSTTPQTPPVLPGSPTDLPPGAEAPSPARLVPTGPVLAPVADPNDVNCSSFIVDSFVEPELYINDREDGARTIFAEGDIVYLSRGMDGRLTPGDEFTIVVKEGVVPHPIFAEDVGESIRMVGRVRVIALQEASATAEIVHTCDSIEVGMPLIPYQEIPVPLTTPGEFRRYGVRLDTGNSGYIVDVFPDKASIGAGDIVNIDLGSDNGLQPGDVLTVFREWGGPVSFYSTESYIDSPQARAEKRRAKEGFDPGDYAQTVLGQIVVLRTQKHTATAKVTLSARELNLGDRVAAR